MRQKRAIVTFKTRIGSVFQSKGSFGKKAFGFGFSLSPGYKEWDLYTGESYSGGDVTLDARIITDSTGAKGWTRQNSLEWQRVEPQEGVISLSYGFIVGGTIEIDYGQAIENFKHNWAHAWQGLPYDHSHSK